ncbi:DNA polymerase alpha subunit B [Spathaspora sp. JA1]|nr:DNA polymerase alpha subunit B [Spathaspora sp. JA1]
MSVEDSFKNQIVTAFGPSTSSLNDDEFSKLKNLSELYNFPIDELYLQWESFNVAEVQEDLELNLENLGKFHQFLQTKLSKSTPVSIVNTHSNSRKPLMRKQINNPSTPNIKKRKLEQSSPLAAVSSPASDFATANNTFVAASSPVAPTPAPVKPSHSLLETLNPTVEEIEGKLDDLEEGGKKLFKLGTNFDISKYKFRTMQMKLLEAADVLDDQIDTMMKIYQDSHSDSDLQFGNPCLSSQFDILCCGRIVPDSPLYENNVVLNNTSLYLETSRMQGIGQRVPLDISKLTSYSFFPGQIVVFKGRNPSGKSFIVDEVKELPQLGMAVSSGEEIKEIQTLQGNQGLKILVASGPFSNSQTLNYDRLNNLVDLINTKILPSVVILNGPFIDITNKSVEEGEFDLEQQQAKNLDEVFKSIITPILKKIDSRIQVVLYPSLKDTCISHCSYPQDIFDRKKFGLPKNIKIFPNPSSFSINEILIGSSNLDVFKDLRDVTSGSMLNNRFERIVSHIIDQRKYYPLFPGVAAKASSDSASSEHLNTIGGSSLEIPYLGLSEIGDVLPDVLILPSELKFFAKVIKGVLVINPGSFIRPNKDANRQEGSYAVVHVQPPLQSNLEESSTDLYFHNIYTRSRVDIFSS